VSSRHQQHLVRPTTASTGCRHQRNPHCLIRRWRPDAGHPLVWQKVWRPFGDRMGRRPQVYRWGATCRVGPMQTNIFIQWTGPVQKIFSTEFHENLSYSICEWTKATCLFPAVCLHRNVCHSEKQRRVLVLVMGLLRMSAQ